MIRLTGLALGLALSLVACGPADAEQQLEELKRMAPPAAATRVEVVTLRPSDARLRTVLPGEVEGWDDAMLAAALGGYVESVDVAAGDLVDKGQVLLQVDAEMYRAALAQAEVQQAQAASDLSREQAMGDLATPARLDSLQTSLKIADANLRQARARVARSVIRAPFAGTVGLVGVSQGEVAPPGSPVLRLVQLDPVKVTLSVPDVDVVALEAGLAVDVTTAAMGETLTGVIAHVSPVADTNTRAFPVEVRVDNPGGKLLPGMVTRVTVEREISEGAMIIPQDWLVTRLTDYGLYVEQDGKAAWRPVVLGAVVHGTVVVREGLSPGDRVIITGQRDVQEGDEVLVAREGTCCTDGRPVF